MTMKSLAAAFATVLAASAAQAGLINIQLLDVDVTYSGANNMLRDEVAAAGGTFTPSEADPVVAANFELGGVQVASLMSPGLYADLLIANMPSTLPNFAFTPNVGNAGGGFGFEFFTDEYSLELGVGSIDVFVSPFSVFFTASATVLSQDLPAGLAFGSTVNISYTASSPAVQAGATTNSMMASGVMTISGEMAVIPEPAAAVVAVLGLVGAGCFRRR